MSATVNDFYTALKQAVMFSPQYVQPDSGQGKVWKCRQLQTFRVMQKERGAELISPNLGATICDKNKAFFWSRKWHESGYGDPITFNYPALLLTELSFAPETPFSKLTKRCYTYQLAVVDQQSDDCKACNCESCEKRTINEIFSDTEALLFDSLYYLSGIRGAVLQPGGEEGFWNTGYLDALKEAGTISSYAPGADWGGVLNTWNKGVTAYRISVEATKHYGTAVNFTACFQNCEATEPNFNLPDFALVAREAGCKTCG